MANVERRAADDTLLHAWVDDVTAENRTSASLIERLCRNLAFHLIESELTLSHAEGDIEDWRAKCDEARKLIAEAGFDIDALYPVLDRPSSDGPQ